MQIQFLLHRGLKTDMDFLIGQEIALHQFEVRKNEREVSKLLHADFHEVGKSGRTFDYGSIVESMKAEETPDYIVHSQDYEVIKLAGGAYLLLYKSAVIDGQGRLTSFAKRSSVWIKVEDTWKLRYHQGTPCQEFQIGNE